MLQSAIHFREAKRAINNFLCLGCRTVVITLGKDGAIFASASEPRPIHVRAPKVEEVLDTTVRTTNAVHHMLNTCKLICVIFYHWSGSRWCICWRIGTLFGSLSGHTDVEKGCGCRLHSVDVGATVWYAKQLPISQVYPFRYQFEKFRLELCLMPNHLNRRTWTGYISGVANVVFHPSAFLLDFS